MSTCVVGTGDWEADTIPLEKIFEAAEEWRRIVGAIDRPWLVWHVSDRWSWVQQLLILHVGWTPVVGRDPAAPIPTLAPGSVFVDFNARFGFSKMWLHFVIEFSWLFCKDRLAFWHADLLCRLSTMERLAEIFESLRPGELAAVKETGGIRNWLRWKRHRYWELVGCQTNEASRSHWETGTGWWRHFAFHPNCPDAAERERRRSYYWDHGTGIMYWKRRYGGRVRDIPLKLVAEGHCTSIGNPRYRFTWGSPARKDLTVDLDANYQIETVCRRLGIESLLALYDREVEQV